MNWVDIALLIVIFLALISGVSSGFIAGSIHLLNWLGSLFLALIFYPYTATALTKIFPALGVWKLPLAFILTVIVASLVIGFLRGDCKMPFLTALKKAGAMNCLE